MARELYNWDQARGYLIVAASNYNKKNEENKIDINNLLNDYDVFQTQIGKEGVIGYSKRLMSK